MNPHQEKQDSDAPDLLKPHTPCPRCGEFWHSHQFYECVDCHRKLCLLCLRWAPEEFRLPRNEIRLLAMKHGPNHPATLVAMCIPWQCIDCQAKGM
jgi:hypothetical protein